MCMFVHICIPAAQLINFGQFRVPSNRPQMTKMSSPKKILESPSMGIRVEVPREP